MNRNTNYQSLKVNQTNTNEDAKRLYDDLLSSYNYQIRPVEKQEDIIELRLGLKLSQIADIVIEFFILIKNTFNCLTSLFIKDERNQIMTTNVILK